MKKFIAVTFGFRSCGEGSRLLRRMGLVTSLGALTLLAAVSDQTNAQTLTTLLSFNGTNGHYPTGSLTLNGSTLYGMTENGGAYGYGTVFSIPVSGGTPTNLLSFNDTNGAQPLGSLTLSGSTLYGMTSLGGIHDEGTVFSVSVTGGTTATLLSFSGTNGSNPEGDLTLSGSTFCGMTLSGGTFGGGNVFSIGTNGSGFKNLLLFSGTNGDTPYRSLTLSGTTLYGMTSQGGTNKYGNIFSIGTNGSGFKNLFSFSGTNGNTPLGSLTLSGSTLYGMTSLGGTNGEGNIFSISTNGSSFQNLFSFSFGGSNGYQPYGSLTLSGSTLYGMTPFGGASGDGNIFSIGTNGSGFKNLLSFSGTNGKNPYGSLTLSGSTLYGMTAEGGTDGDGTVFALNGLGVVPAKIMLSGVFNATIISSGTATLGVTVSNSAASGANNLNYTLTATIQSGNAAIGSVTPSSGSLAPTTSQPCTVTATSTNLGVNTISFTASDPNASNSPQTTTATLTVLGHSNPALSVTGGNNQSVIVGATNISASLSLTDSGTNLSPLDVNTLSGLSGSSGTAVVASGGSTSYTAALNTASIGQAGTQSFSLKAGDEQALPGASALSSLSQTVILNVLGHASGSATGTTIGLPWVHVGYTGSLAGTTLASVSNASGYLVDLKTLGATTFGDLSINNVSGIAPGGSAAIAATLANGQPAAAINQTFNLNYADDSALAGASSSLGSLSITVTGEIYSGQGVWAAAGSGNWHSFGNWTAGGGVPGVDGTLSAGDRATFGSAIGSSSATVTLDTPVAVSAITFSNTAGGSYTLSGKGSNTLTLNNSGNGTTITVTNGIHVIDAPVVLADNFVVSGSGTLNFDNASSISDNGGHYSLTMSGIGGTLIVSG
ncbi:MAG: beta strand repeat-containing protein, partial [Thermoguttaceae bacterium]